PVRGAAARARGPGDGGRQGGPDARPVPLGGGAGRHPGHRPARPARARPLRALQGPAYRRPAGSTAVEELGLQVQDFGRGTLLLASYPALLGKRSPSGILRAVADHLAASGLGIPSPRAALVASLPCLGYRGVKAMNHPTPPEHDELLLQARAGSRPALGTLLE